MKPLPVGKLPGDLLAELLKRWVPGDPRVLVGPGLGEDAAVIDMGDRCLVAATDPITFATDEIGWYAVHVNANDVACCGARPRWFLATLLLPERQTTAELADSLFSQLAQACRQIGVALCGGHTEITAGLDRPLITGFMLGEVANGQYVTTAGVRPGDALILTKSIAVEGTALIVRERRGELASVLSPQQLEKAERLLYDPGISVVRDAQLALEAGEVHSLHDPTEGGIATGLRELADAGGVGLRIREDCLPILSECATICRHFGLDPLGLIASGSLLIAAAAGSAQDIVKTLERAGISAAEIGEAINPEHGLSLQAANGSTRPLPSFPRDELARLFA